MYQLNKLPSVSSVGSSHEKQLSSSSNLAKKDACSALSMGYFEKGIGMTWFEDDFSTELNHLDQAWGQEELVPFDNVNDTDNDIRLHWN